MPMTGFTVSIKKSETVDLNISVDQAIQFVVSCGVVVPPQQVVKLAAKPLSAPGTGNNNGGPALADRTTAATGEGDE